MSQSVYQFQLLYLRSFFVDKHAVRNILVCPTVLGMVLKVSLGSLPLTCTLFSKIMFLFYIETGQKPQILIKGYNLRGIRKIRVVGLQLNLTISNRFYMYVLQRQVAISHRVLSSMVYSVKYCTFFLNYKTQDDDVLAQQIKFFGTLNYQATLRIKSSTHSHAETLLSNLKVYY